MIASLVGASYFSKRSPTSGVSLTADALCFARPHARNAGSFAKVEPVFSIVEPRLRFAVAAKPEIQKRATQTGPTNTPK
jgi:hypothetical protein